MAFKMKVDTNKDAKCSIRVYVREINGSFVSAVCHRPSSVIRYTTVLFTFQKSTTMVRNFGEKRKRKSHHKKSKSKNPRGTNDMEEVCNQVAIYMSPEQRAAENKARMEEPRSSRPKNTYRSKRMERQRLKKDRKRGEDWAYSEEDEDDDEDDVDFGGEYDEIIRTGPSRREAREAREAERLASAPITSISFGPRPTTRSRRGRGCPGRRARNVPTGYDFEEFSMLDFVMMSLFNRLQM